MNTLTDAQRLTWGDCGRTQRRSTVKRIGDRRIAARLENRWMEMESSQEAVKAVDSDTSRRVSGSKEETNNLCPAQICVQNAERDVKYRLLRLRRSSATGTPSQPCMILCEWTLPSLICSSLYKCIMVLIGHFHTFAKH